MADFEVILIKHIFSVTLSAKEKRFGEIPFWITKTSFPHRSTGAGKILILDGGIGRLPETNS